MLRVGDQLDKLQFTDARGRVYEASTLREYKGIALFFYPKDFTAICTAQVCAFRDHYVEIRQLGGIAFGVSKDGNELHEKFQRKNRLPYELISDRGGQLGQTFGVRRWRGWLWHRRVTFILTSDWRVADVIHDERNATLHAERFIAYLRSLG